MKAFTKPGKYIAICNTGRFDGFYAKEFDFPDLKKDPIYATIADEISAEWWFLNRIDGVACLVAVYPKEIFDKMGTHVYYNKNKE